MRCELCGCDPDIIVILPIKKQDGCLNTIACLKCSKKSGHYCEKHERPHLGFEGDDTSACVFCIEEMVSANFNLADRIFNRLNETVSALEMERLLEAAEIAGEITGQSTSVCVLRFIATKALRLKKTINEMIGLVVQGKNVDIILSEMD